MRSLSICMKKATFAATLAAVVLIGLPAVSQAVPVLMYSIDGGTPITVTGSSTGTVTSSGTSNLVTFSFIGNSKPALGSSQNPNFDLSSVSLTNGGFDSSTVNVWLTDTGFYSQHQLLHLLSSYGGTQNRGSTAQFWSYANGNDQPFNTSTPLLNSGGITAASFQGSSSSTEGFTYPYSLTLHALFTLGSGSQVTSTDQNIKNVIPAPEPGDLGMMGLGLLLVGMLGLRFRQAKYRRDH